MDAQQLVYILATALIGSIGGTASAVAWGFHANKKVFEDGIENIKNRLDTHSGDIKTVGEIARENGWSIDEAEKKIASHADRIERLTAFANQVKATHNSIHPTAKINGL